MTSLREAKEMICRRFLVSVVVVSISATACSGGHIPPPGVERSVSVIERSEGKPGPAPKGPIRGMNLSPDAPSYPSQLETTLQAAADAAGFVVIVPDTDLANSRILTNVFLWPDGQSIALDFPAPTEPKSPIRQNYIEVYESLWTAGDPMADFKADMAADPVEGKVILDIVGTPALGVEAHSPDVVDKINAAFLRFVIGDVEVQVSGGESLDVLTEIAKQMILAAGKG